MKASPRYPVTNPPVTRDCMDCIRSLLTADVTQRIGALSFHTYTHHPFFVDIDFAALERKELNPIFKPSSEKTNFDATYDLEELLLEEAPLEARARRQKPRERLKDDATAQEIREEELHKMIETLFEPFDYTTVAYDKSVRHIEATAVMLNRYLDILEQWTQLLTLLVLPLTGYGLLLTRRAWTWRLQILFPSPLHRNRRSLPSDLQHPGHRQSLVPIALSLAAKIRLRHRQYGPTVAMNFRQCILGHPRAGLPVGGWTRVGQYAINLQAGEYRLCWTGSRPGQIWLISPLGRYGRNRLGCLASCQSVKDGRRAPSHRSLVY